MEEALAALAAELGRRREAIVSAWRTSVRRDHALTTGDSLPRVQLDDHIPALLRSFERKLASAAHETAATDAGAEGEQAAAHGMHRWQQGYDLLEVSRELGRLNECVVAELDDCARSQPERGAEVMATARRVWSQVLSVGIARSTAQYFKLRQIEAAGHIRDLERALEDLRDLERQRAELWHEVAHDLRGNLSVVVNATSGLAMPAIDEPVRGGFLRMLERNVRSLHHLLDDVTDLARLSAGRERRQTEEFDAAALLDAMCEDVRALALQRGLYLEAEGPPGFVVQGDAVKTRRLAQNLILNAIKYTQRGGVRVRWGDSDTPGDARRWMLSVADTGPGLAGRSGPSSQLTEALGAATEMAHEDHVPSPHDAALAAQDGSAGALPAVAPETRHGAAGEGIGLSIVKRLAELLDAAVEVETADGHGTVFRVYLPRRYDGA